MDTSTFVFEPNAPPSLPPFPISRFRRVRFPGGRPHCLYCATPRVQRWGCFSGRQRYRCTACGRTFSDFTGTPLAHLKLLDRWPAFCDCILASLTVRHAARLLDVNKDTAFRWRHRLLGALGASDTTTLRSNVVLQETWFAHSEKGSRHLDRPARSRRALHRSEITAVWVQIARDPAGRTASGVVGPRRPGPHDLEALLIPRLHPDAELVSAIGYYGAPARMADRTGHSHRRVPHHDPELSPIRAYVLHLHRWIRRFRGVATRYLDNYLAWHRLLTGPDPPDGPDPGATGS